MFVRGEVLLTTSQRNDSNIHPVKFSWCQRCGLRGPGPVDAAKGNDTYYPTTTTYFRVPTCYVWYFSCPSQLLFSSPCLDMTSPPSPRLLMGVRLYFQARTDTNSPVVDTKRTHTQIDIHVRMYVYDTFILPSICVLFVGTCKVRVAFSFLLDLLRSVIDSYCSRICKALCSLCSCCTLFSCW